MGDNYCQQSIKAVRVGSSSDINANLTRGGGAHHQPVALLELLEPLPTPPQPQQQLLVISTLTTSKGAGKTDKLSLCSKPQQNHQKHRDATSHRNLIKTGTTTNAATIKAAGINPSVIREREEKGGERDGDDTFICGDQKQQRDASNRNKLKTGFCSTSLSTTANDVTAASGVIIKSEREGVDRPGSCDQQCRRDDPSSQQQQWQEMGKNLLQKEQEDEQQWGELMIIPSGEEYTENLVDSNSDRILKTSRGKEQDYHCTLMKTTTKQYSCGCSCCSQLTSGARGVEENVNNNNEVVVEKNKKEEETTDRVAALICQCCLFNEFSSSSSSTQVYSCEESIQTAAFSHLSLVSSTCADNKNPEGERTGEEGEKKNYNSNPDNHNPPCKQPRVKCRPNGLTGSQPLLRGGSNRSNDEGGGSSFISNSSLIVEEEGRAQGFASVLNGVSVAEPIPSNSSGRHDDGGVVSKGTAVTGDNAAVEKEEGRTLGVGVVVLKREHCDNGADTNHILLCEDCEGKQRGEGVGEGYNDGCMNCRATEGRIISGGSSQVPRSSCNREGGGVGDGCESSGGKKQQQLVVNGGKSSLREQQNNGIHCNNHHCHDCLGSTTNNKSLQVAPLSPANGSVKHGEAQSNTHNNNISSNSGGRINSNSSGTCAVVNGAGKLTSIKCHVCARITSRDIGGEGGCCDNKGGTLQAHSEETRQCHVIKEEKDNTVNNTARRDSATSSSCTNHISQPSVPIKRRGRSGGSNGTTRSSKALSETGTRPPSPARQRACRSHSSSNSNSTKDGERCSRSSEEEDESGYNKLGRGCSHLTELSQFNITSLHLQNHTNSHKDSTATTITTAVTTTYSTSAIAALASRSSNNTLNEGSSINTGTEQGSASPPGSGSNRDVSGKPASGNAGQRLESGKEPERNGSTSSHGRQGNNLDYTAGDHHRVINLNDGDYGSLGGSHSSQLGGGGGDKEEKSGIKEEEGNYCDWRRDGQGNNSSSNNISSSGSSRKNSLGESCDLSTSGDDENKNNDRHTDKHKNQGDVYGDIKHKVLNEVVLMHDTRTQSSQLNSSALPLQLPAKGRGKKLVEIANFTFSQLSSPDRCCNSLEDGEDSLDFVKSSRYDRDPLFEPEDTTDSFFKKHRLSLRLKSFFGIIGSEDEDDEERGESPGETGSLIAKESADKLVALKRSIFSSSQHKTKSKDSENDLLSSPKTPVEILASKLGAFFGISFDGGDDTNNNNTKEKTYSRQSSSDFVDLENEVIYTETNCSDSVVNNNTTNWDDDSGKHSKGIGDIGRKFSLDSQRSSQDRQYESGFLCQRSFEESFLHVNPWFEDNGTQACVKTEIIYLYNYRNEEPAVTNMDISTGHIVLSYMEDHLKNKDRLDQEWEALEAYEAEPNATLVAMETANMRKNRYSDLLPYDHSRVVLNSTTNVSASDYINATTITDHDPRNPAYIATQGPLPHTVADFWQMVWEQGSVVIVTLTKLTEGGNAMCHRYWPEEGSDLYHIYEVHLVSEHIWCDDYLVRSFYLKNLQTGETRTVTQFHFQSWADLDVPASIKALLDFRRKVNKSFRGRSCPVVVHCSDGVGRTGTYCLIDMVLNRMSKGAKEIDIAATLEHIRDQRMGMVRTKPQFEFALASVAEEVTAILKALPQSA